MTLFTGMNTTASALTAQRLRMDVISSNMANVDTTRGKMVDGEWQPYQRKSVVMVPKGNQFSSFLNQAMNTRDGHTAGGVQVSRIEEDEQTLRLILLSDKVSSELIEEENPTEIFKVAEEKIKYLKTKKLQQGNLDFDKQ